MPVNNQELIAAIAMIADEANVRVTVKQSGKGSMVCAACSFVGGLLLGPPGLALGGIAGGVAAYKLTSGTFRPLGDIIMNDLTDLQREQLVNHVRDAVAELQPADVIQLLPLLMGSHIVKEAVLKTVCTFVSNELRLQVVD